MINERHMRNKRSSFIINVIETPNGFSIVEGTELLNKPDHLHSNPNPNPPSTNHNTHTITTIKQYKPVFKKTNLVFLKKQQPTRLQLQTADQEIIPTPEFCKIFAQWFDLNRINQLEKKEVIQWFCQKFGCSQSEAQQRQEFSTWLKNYKKHRNFIVKLYQQQFASQQKYLSASYIRKYLCYDSYWVMKLHLLLSNLGIINSHAPNFALQASNRTHIFKTNLNGKRQLLSHELSTKIYNNKIQDNGQILKKLTSQLRPYCDFCRIHCGIVWFQHVRNLDPKQIANIMKNVNSKNPPLSQKQYQYILCIRCYCQNNFPLLLTHHDFKKICINDKLDPSRKKRSKRRRRQKRRRQQGQDEEIQPKQQVDDKSHQDQQDHQHKKEEIKKTISKLVQFLQKKQWKLQEIDYLLELVQKYEENWIKIHEQMKKKGFCKEIQTQQLILYFLSLPQRGIVQLQQEYDQQEFVQANFSNNRMNIQDRLSQRKLNDSLQFVAKAGKKVIEEITQQANRDDYQWRKYLKEIIRLQMRKYQGRIEHLQQCQVLVRTLSAFDGGK